MVQVEINGTKWEEKDGWVRKQVAPGSPEDDTQGQVGWHCVYIQYARGPEADYIRAEILPALYAAERAQREAKEAAEAAEIKALLEKKDTATIRPCPKCGTYCYGDCESN